MTHDIQITNLVFNSLIVLVDRATHSSHMATRIHLTLCLHPFSSFVCVAMASPFFAIDPRYLGIAPSSSTIASPLGSRRAQHFKTLSHFYAGFELVSKRTNGLVAAVSTMEPTTLVTIAMMSIIFEVLCVT